MKILRKAIKNSLRNFNYLVICQATDKALAVDPLDADSIFKMAENEGVEITHILNTHEHHDHVAGNQQLVKLTGAQVYAHHAAQVPEQSHHLQDGDTFQVGNQKFLALYTPGHTERHICLLTTDEQGVDHFFSGDTLFNACAGNCYNGGNVVAMYHSFAGPIAELADDTRIYPGHDYMKNNLAFAATREPSNTDISRYQQQIEGVDADDMPIMTMGDERRYNSFLRLENEAIINQLKQDCGDFIKQITQLDHIPSKLQACDVFRALRHLRDQW